MELLIQLFGTFLIECLSVKKKNARILGKCRLLLLLLEPTPPTLHIIFVLRVQILVFSKQNFRNFQVFLTTCLLRM